MPANLSSARQNCNRCLWICFENFRIREGVKGKKPLTAEIAEAAEKIIT